MDERVMQFRVGVVVLFALIVTAIVLVLFGKLPSLIPGRHYTLYVRFDYCRRSDRGNARPQERHSRRPRQRRPIRPITTRGSWSR